MLGRSRSVVGSMACSRALMCGALVWQAAGIQYKGPPNPTCDQGPPGGPCEPCEIDCGGSSAACKDDTITCPADCACKVLCDAAAGCKNAEIILPSTPHNCIVTIDGFQAGLGVTYTGSGSVLMCYGNNDTKNGCGNAPGGSQGNTSVAPPVVSTNAPLAATPGPTAAPSAPPTQ
eukprot:Hpha_TRINITY_DN36238_c0_g1::TRINITY_DN36238_c0_g1_i1::g.83198::m.83198